MIKAEFKTIESYYPFFNKYMESDHIELEKHAYEVKQFSKVCPMKCFNKCVIYFY